MITMRLVMNNSILKLCGAAFLCLVLSACEQNSPSINDADDKSQQSSETTADVLALVNGEEITQDDIDFMIERTFSGAEQLFFDQKMQDKVLESLIAATAMRQQMKASLSEDQLKEIADKTRAYQDELFVKEYLVQHASPVPVSTKQVTQYYKEYPEEFGGGESRLFEMLLGSSELSDEQREQLLTSISSLQSDSNWSLVAKSNNNLEYKKATLQPGLFSKKIELEVGALSKGEASNTIFIDGRLHVFRVLAINSIAPKPLSGVSAQIRKKLSALQLKKAVKSASEEAVSQANVVRN